MFVFLSQGLDNRWLVKVSSVKAASHLVAVGIYLYNRQIFIRFYDDVLAEEYREYQDYEEMENQLWESTKKQVQPVDLVGLNQESS